MFKCTIIFVIFLILCIFFFNVFLQLVKLAKKLKKEKVNIDVVNFGEEVKVMELFYHFMIYRYILL